MLSGCEIGKAATSAKKSATEIEMERNRVWMAGLVIALVWVNWRPRRSDPSDRCRPGSRKVSGSADFQYVEGGHERNRLDLYLPEKAEGRLPLRRLDSRWGLAGRQQGQLPGRALDRQGYAVASRQLPLSQHAVFPGPRSRTARPPSAVAPGQRRQVTTSTRPHRRLGLFSPAGHLVANAWRHRRRQGVGGPWREP